MISLNDLYSINCKQSHSAATCVNGEINHKIWFLFACHSNVNFSQPLFWLIIVQHAGRDRSSEYRVSNSHRYFNIFKVFFVVIFHLKNLIHQNIDWQAVLCKTAYCLLVTDYLKSVAQPARNMLLGFLFNCPWSVSAGHMTISVHCMFFKINICVFIELDLCNRFCLQNSLQRLWTRFLKYKHVFLNRTDWPFWRNWYLIL